MRHLFWKGCAFLPALFISQSAVACITCNKKVREAIFDSQFYPNLLTMLSAFVVLALVVGGLTALSARRHAAVVARYKGTDLRNPVPLTTAALVLGIGLGGFVDGIVLHQILQWHEMLSNKIPPDTLVRKSVNMFWDGIFHAFTLLVTLIGVVLLWRVGRSADADRSGRLLAGGLLGGWGVFNIIEGIIDHHLLKLHNVREITPNVAAWNWGFLGFSVVLIGIAYALIKQRSRHADL